MSKNKILIYVSLLFFTFFIHEITAQNRFKAGVVAGFNVAQIRGDDTGGFNKLGVVGGVRAIILLGENLERKEENKMDVTLELLYSQRGSRANGTEQRRLGRDVEIDLNYVEVPVLFNYKDWYDEGDEYYKIQASGGFAYSRLINSRSAGDTNTHNNEVENFNENDVSLILGAEYFITPKISVSARWGTSINLLYNSEKNDQDLNSLRGHFLSFRTNYLF